jgi:hypothetical protein
MKLQRHGLDTKLYAQAQKTLNICYREAELELITICKEKNKVSKDCMIPVLYANKLPLGRLNRWNQQ